MDDASHHDRERLTAIGWLVIVGAYLLVPLVLIGVGRDPRWWQAWAYSAVVTAAGVGGRAWAEQRHPGLLADRLRYGRGQVVKPWDRLLSPLMGLGVLYLPILVAAFDHRNGWTPALSVGSAGAGLLCCALGYGFAIWALAENPFFTSVVRIQTERGHEVCDTGPYRIVRHPAYAGNVLALFGLPLALGSGWTAAATAAGLAVSVLRTALEDRTLREELDGYAAYARRVRFRLVPGLW